MPIINVLVTVTCRCCREILERESLTSRDEAYIRRAALSMEKLARRTYPDRLTKVKVEID